MCARELAVNFDWDCDFRVNSGIFYVPQICDTGPTALLPFQRKACWGFFRPEKYWRLRPGLNPRTRILKGSALPLDHRSRQKLFLLQECVGRHDYYNFFYFVEGGIDWMLLRHKPIFKVTFWKCSWYIKCNAVIDKVNLLTLQRGGN